MNVRSLNEQNKFIEPKNQLTDILFINCRIYSSSSPPPVLFPAFFRATRPWRAPDSGDLRLKSMCFWESRRTTKLGTSTTCFRTRMCRCRIKTRAWWTDLARPSLKTWVCVFKGQQVSGGFSDLGQQHLDSPDFFFVFEAELSDEFQLGVESFLLEGSFWGDIRLVVVLRFNGWHGFD